MRRADWVGGGGAYASPNSDSRPAGTKSAWSVLHSISLPRGEYGGDAIERLFTNRLDPVRAPLPSPISRACASPRIS
jgi:AmpD protein